MSKRLTYEVVSEYFKTNGCTLLEEKYINNSTKMKYICSCGNISVIKLSNFKNGQRCMECSGNKKHTYDDIIKIVESNGFKLHSKEYKGANSKLIVECKDSHVHEMNLSVIKRGGKCPYCVGNAKYSYEEVYNFFKENECVLLEKEYKNANSKLKYKCSCGNKSTTTFSDFKRGRRCKECGRKKLAEKNSFDYEFVKNFFEKEGFKLISRSYKNNSEKLEVECPNSHKYNTTFQSFRNGHRCRICSGFNIYTIDDVINAFENENCKLLEDEYINMHTKMRYICKCGNEDLIDFAHFLRGQKCSKCANKKRADTHRLSYDYIKIFIKNKGYSLVSEEYVNAHERLHLVCPEGHDYFPSFDSFKSGKRCSICSGLYKYNIDIIRELFKNEKCKLLEKSYHNSTTPMKYICTCGNVSCISLSSFLRGTRCNKCGNMKSSEKQRLDFNIILKEFKNRGCILLSKRKEYKNKESTKLKFLCKCGTYHETTWSSFKYSETGCFNCKNKLISEKLRKYNIKELKVLFEQRGFTLTSLKFVNTRIPLEFICDKGHNAKTHLYHFLNGSGCRTCYIESVKGENSPHWNPNLTDEERIFRRQYPEYKEWRHIVFERDDYTCQCCGKTGGIYLHAHHLDNYAEYIDKRLDTENGITLCEDCHDDFHRMYGTKSNTREQFEEYMEGISWNCKGIYNSLVL